MLEGIKAPVQEPFLRIKAGFLSTAFKLEHTLIQHKL